MNSFEFRNCYLTYACTSFRVSRQLDTEMVLRALFVLSFGATNFKLEYRDYNLTQLHID